MKDSRMNCCFCFEFDWRRFEFKEFKTYFNIMIDFNYLLTVLFVVYYKCNFNLFENLLIFPHSHFMGNIDYFRVNYFKLFQVNCLPMLLLNLKNSLSAHFFSMFSLLNLNCFVMLLSFNFIDWYFLVTFKF